MRNIALVTGREYTSRVRKKSFVVMTLLGPFLLAAFYGGIIWLAVSDTRSNEVKHIHVLDESGLFSEGIEGSSQIVYTINPDEDTVRDYYGTLMIPANFSPDHPEGARFLSSSSLNIMEQQAMENHLEKAVKEHKLIRSGLRKETLDSLETNVSISAAVINDGVIKEDNSAVNAGAGFVGAFFIYIFIFLYGVQVMKGVAEEKSNRIVEVIISSVKPFDLMMGKIIGIALVGLTQVFIWIGLSTALIAIITPIIASMGMDPNEAATLVQGSAGGAGAPGLGALGALFQLDFVTLIFGFLFYFVTGYLLYSAMFAAIASAVDSETDTQQFMFPITIPLIFSIIIAQSVVIKDPHGELATWFSMIPFTAPIVMMVRLPFGVENWQLVLSMIFMIFGFIGITWLASRIYRVGILMYGKKPTYKELIKWMLYKG